MSVESSLQNPDGRPKMVTKAESPRITECVAEQSNKKDKR